MKRVLLLLLLTGMCLAQVQVRTRTVLLFGGLEKKIAHAQNTTERAQFLTDDFEERKCAAPGSPVPRQQWLASPSVAFSFSQEAVHDYGDVAIYSAMAETNRKEYMVVDTWRKQGDSWKLAVRYLCPASGQKPETTLPKRY